MKRYFERHLQVLVESVGQLYRQRLGALLTALVIGVSLALPASLLLSLATLRQAADGWDGEPRLTAYLKLDVPDARATDLAARLGRELAAQASVTLIDRTQALAEFEHSSGLTDALALVGENPLPAALVLAPKGPADEALLEQLATRLRALSEVEEVQADLDWVRRLNALLEVGRRAVWVFAGLLGAGVVLVTGNTIRLAIFNRRQEIEVTKLIGGTDAFIRRPFLYWGLLQGVAGGLVAALLLVAVNVGLAAPVRTLAGVYGSSLTLVTAGLSGSLGLLLLGGGLGLAGAWLAVGRHLRDIEPT
ncbi:MAG: permease-like cell division protein FtsX [Immundisolibacter sp.]|uniref:permease-like cell division protein FtsX n=1 Tax=Immundisolibacter sp. TaxID=1934948 RepID=UPI003EE11ED4